MIYGMHVKITRDAKDDTYSVCVGDMECGFYRSAKEASDAAFAECFRIVTERRKAHCHKEKR